MGICTRRHFLLSICMLQLISTVERQVFDFLGYMWIPILVNFFEIIFVIFGFFGAYQYRPKYVISYSIWNLFLLTWNIFLICLYLDIGILNHQESKVLKLDPDSASWWQTNGPGCKVIYNTNATFPKLETVTDCLVDYTHVEVFHAGMQCLLAFLGCLTGFCLSRTFLKEDDSSGRSLGRKATKRTKRTSLYSIEFSPQHEVRQVDSDGEYGAGAERPAAPVSPKPMTPRRVKRRSVMTRGSTSRHSSGSRRRSTGRSSGRSSGRRIAQNPVTRIIEQQQQQTVHSAGYEGSEADGSPPLPAEPLPMYFNSSVSSSNLLGAPSPSPPPPTQRRQPAQWQLNGHTNPTYQQSSSQSLNEQDDLDDLYNNRPASVRSSYSNFHGTRAISYGAPQYYHGHATPQVPHKRTAPAARHSMRTMAFLNNGPPAYSTGSTAAVDSETAI